MSVCPRPDSVATSSKGTLASLVVSPPPATYEACGSTITTTTGGGAGGTTTTTIYIQGPPGPQGPKGDTGCSLGLVWKGNWAADVQYKAQSCPSNPNADVIQLESRTFVCVEDHLSTVDGGDKPVDFSGGFYWELMTGNDGTTSQLLPEEKSFFDKLKDNVFDWIKNADLTDWLLLGAAAVGIIWAGSKILDMMKPNAHEGDGNSDQRYNGSPAYSGSYTAPTIKNVVEQLCIYSNVSYDVSALGDDECEFVIGTNTAVQVILETLSLAYQFDILTSFGILKFVPRNVTPVATIALSDMGFSSSTTPPPPFTARRFQGIDLPNQVTLNYYSAALDYGKYNQTATLFTYKEGTAVNLEVPVTLTDAKAKQIVETTLINAHLERMNYVFNTSYKFIHIEPGDVINSPMGNLRILKIEETEEGILKFEASDAGEPAALDPSNLSLQPPPSTNNVPTVIGYSQGLWIDPPNLNDQDKNVRVYCAVHGYGQSGWPGAAIYMSSDGGSSYSQVSQSLKEATVGLVASATPSADYHIWDNTTTISVTLKTGTLLSKAEIAVLNGDNWAMVGQEVIGFKTATLTAPNTYTLSGLLRGLQGTEVYIDSHVTNELFCLIDDGLVKIEFPDSERKTVKKFKVVTFGSSLDVTASEDVQIVSNNTLMWQPLKCKAVMSGQDWVITAEERVRFDNQLKDYVTTNHDVDWAGMGYAILGAGDVVKRTYVNQGEPFTYTAAEQVSDFGTLQNTLKVSIVQLSQKWGGGLPKIINS